MVHKGGISYYWRSGLVALSIFSALLCPRAHSAPSSSDLKSDLELEMEKDDDDQPSQSETPKTKPRKTRGTLIHSGGVSRPEPTSANVESRIDQAQKYVDAKQYTGAVNILAPMLDSLSRSGLLLLARAYAGQSDSLNEIRTLDLCVAKNPKDYVAKTAQGNALVRVKGRLDDGLMALQDAIKLNPRYRPAYDSLIRELEKKGERYEARNVLNDMIKVFGEKPEFFTTLCRLYALDAFNERSVEICEQAISNDPKVAENHMYLGLALRDREEVDKAMTVLNNAVKRFPASEPVHYAMGEIYVTKKDYVRAYGFFKQAALANPDSVRSWVGYGKTAFLLQKNQEALNAFVRACKREKTLTRDFRSVVGEFRSAIGELRVRHDGVWQTRFEMGINECQ